MRFNSLVPLAILLFAGSMRAQNVEQTLQWARENINAHAVTHRLEPPSRISGTKWEVSRIEGCTVELKEMAHREAPESVANSEGVFGFSEDKTVTYTFDLGALLPRFIMADTSEGAPHLKIFALGDAFHQKTESTSKLLKKDGTTQSTTSWSTAGSQRNLTIFFDSPSSDNKVIVRRLETDLREAVALCSEQARVR